MKLFFDHNLSPKLPSALQALYRDYTVVHLTDMFDKDATDIEWITALGEEGGWAIMSGDMRITRNHAERAAFKAAGIVGFFYGASSFKA